MLWKVKYKEVYLFGGIHILKFNSNPYRAQLDKIYGSVQQVIFECDFGDNDFNYDVSQGIRINAFPNNPWIKKAKKRLINIGHDPGHYQFASICRITNVLFSTILEKQGYKHSNGIDSIYFKMAQKDNKKLLYLETIGNNVRNFDCASIGEQIRYLKTLLENKDGGVKKFEKLLASWRENNIVEFRELYAEVSQVCPQLYNCLIDRRNIAWLPQLNEVIESGLSTLVIVGAFHCIGENNSLQTLLENKSGHEFEMSSSECLSSAEA